MRKTAIIPVLIITLTIIGIFIYFQRDFWKVETIQHKKEIVDVGDDNRILLDRKNMEILNKLYVEGFEKWQAEGGCEPEFYTDPANTSILYSNLNMGISLYIPYRQKWGNKKYKISPFYEYETGITFGPIILSENCSWSRLYSIDFVPLQTPKGIITSLVEMADRYGPNEGPLKDSITEKKINNISVIEYVFIDGLSGPIPRIEVIGKKYNYRFGCICNSSPNNIKEYFNFFENIIKTIQFIEK